MPVRVGDVEEALAPLRIARRAVGPAPGGDQPRVESVDIAVVENEAPPPRPPPLGRLRNQVEKILAGAETGEDRVLAAVDDLKIQHAVEANGAPHVVRRQGDSADAFDHRPTPPSSSPPHT